MAYARKYKLPEPERTLKTFGSKPGIKARKPKRKPTSLAKPITKTAVKASPADVASDLAVLKEASVVIAKFEKLVQRN
jgi:hypothetical protein